MSNKSTNEANVFLGYPIPIPEIGISIRVPTIKDMLTNPHYSQYSSIFCLSQEDIWDMIVEKEQKEMGSIPDKAPTPFESLLINCYHSAEFKALAERALLYFTGEFAKIIPEQKLIVFTKEGKDDLKLIDDEDKYFIFQNVIREALGETPKEKPNYNDNPRVARIKAKGRLRERIKKKQGSNNSISLKTMLVAICCMDVGLNPLNIGEITYPAATSLMEMKQDKEKYDTDIRIITGGFGSKNKITPKYWIHNPE